MTHYLETGSTDPYLNLALEDLVLTTRCDGDFVMLWQNDNTIVIGQNQNTDAEINHEAVDKLHVNVVRRATGGGAVYHDLGNLNYSFITDEDEAEKVAFEKFTSPIVAALRDLGLDASASGRNDIMIDGHKVSGTAQRYSQGRVLHHGTLLFSENLDLANEVLAVDPEKIRAKGVKSVRSRIGNIGEMLAEHGTDMSLTEFWDYIREKLTADNDESEGLRKTADKAQASHNASGHDTPLGFTDEELAQAQKLRDEKYATWEWNYGKSWACDIVKKKRFDGGSVEPHIALEHGRIKEIKFYGDFMSLTPLDEIEQALVGCEYRKGAVKKLLESYELKPFFGAISADELVEVVC